MKTALILLPFLLSSPADDRILAVYEISDLVDASIDPASARPGLTITRGITSGTSDGTQTVTSQMPVAGPGAAEVTPEMLAKRKAETERMAERMRNWLEPTLEDGERVRAVGGDMVVALVREEQHRWIESLLKKQRETLSIHDMEVRYIEAPSGGFASAGYKQASAVLENKALLALVKHSEVTEGFAVRNGPRLSGLINHYSSMSMTSGIRYVKEWELVTVQPGRRKVADPTIATARVGDSLEGIAFVLPSGLYGVELQYSRFGVVKPIPTIRVPLGDSGEEAEVARPETTQFEMQAHFALSSGGSALFWAPKPDGSGEIGVLITFRTRS